MSLHPLISTMKREVKLLVSRRIYIFAMVVIPIATALFMVSLLSPGLPVRTPVSLVDLDDSSMSRQLGRTLSALETVDITCRYSNVADAMRSLRSGDTFGFFLIPDDFERDAVGGRSPVLSYYCNMAYYIPGSLSFKGFKTLAVTTSGSIVSARLVSVGADESRVQSLLQPVVVQEHPLHNPWSNYAIYLCNSFIPGIIALMVMLVTVFSVCGEIKYGTSRRWLSGAGGKVRLALIGKLLPHTLVFTCVGVFCQALLYGYNSFPLNCSPVIMIVAMLLLVVACQSVAVIFCSLVPNLRLAMSIVSLLGILSFSVTGFSFPVESMYGAVGIFSYLIPVRHFFLIYVDQALNGIALYYSRWQFIALIVFPAVAALLSPLLRNKLSHPVNVP